MKKIVLMCAGGMSTGLLVMKMRKVAKERGLDYDINACATTMAEDVGGDADCVLLGPQVRFQLDTVQKKLSCPVGVIDMKDYGRQNAEAVLAQACELMGEDA